MFVQNPPPSHYQPCDLGITVAPWPKNKAVMTQEVQHLVKNTGVKER